MGSNSPNFPQGSYGPTQPVQPPTQYGNTNPYTPYAPPPPFSNPYQTPPPQRGNKWLFVPLGVIGLLLVIIIVLLVRLLPSGTTSSATTTPTPVVTVTPTPIPLTPTPFTPSTTSNLTPTGPAQKIDVGQGETANVIPNDCVDTYTFANIHAQYTVIPDNKRVRVKITSTGTVTGTATIYRNSGCYPET